MDGVGEVERRGVAAQAHDLALGREDKNLVLEEVNTEVGEELVRIAHIVLDGPVEAAADPVDLVVDAAVLGVHLALGVAVALVEPVGGDTVFSLVMHRVGTDLDLDRAGVRADDRGVQ